MLDFVPRRQSRLEAVAQVKKVCHQEVVNKMLVDEDDRRSDWEIEVLPPQTEDEMFYRCIFGRGNRYQPLQLAPPS
jgi:hypothetical protein